MPSRYPILESIFTGDNENRAVKPTHLLFSFNRRKCLPNHVHHRVPAPANTTIGVRLNARLDNLAGPLDREPRIVADQTRQGICRVAHGLQVAAEAYYGFYLVTPTLLQSLLIRHFCCAGWPHAIEQHQRTNLLRISRSVATHDVPAQTVTHQNRRSRGAIQLEMFDQRPQVSDKLNHGIAARIVTMTMTPQVQGQYTVAVLKGADDTGHTQAMIPHTVQQDHRWLFRIAKLDRR